jgi:hypothetical protein
MASVATAAPFSSHLDVTPNPEELVVHPIEFGFSGIRQTNCTKNHKHSKQCKSPWTVELLRKVDRVASAFGAFHAVNKSCHRNDFFICHSGLFPSREILVKRMKNAKTATEFLFPMKSPEDFENAALLFFVLFMGCQFSSSDNEMVNRPMNIRFRRDKNTIAITFSTKELGENAMSHLRKTDAEFAYIEKSCVGGGFTVENFFHKKK